MQFWQLLINADPNSQLDSDNLLESTDKRLQEIVSFQQLVEQSLQKMQKQSEKQQNKSRVEKADFSGLNEE